jgi:uncharacterized membrane protein
MFRTLTQTLAAQNPKNRAATAPTPAEHAQALWEASRAVWLAQAALVLMCSLLLLLTKNPQPQPLFVVVFALIALVMFAGALALAGRDFSRLPSFGNALKAAIQLGGIAALPLILALVLAIIEGLRWNILVLLVESFVFLWFGRARLLLIAMDIQPDPATTQPEEEFPLLR